MTEHPDRAWESRVAALAAGFSYPPTPDLASRLRGVPIRRPTFRSAWAYAAVAALLLLSGVLAVPSARAAIFEVLRIGAVRILVGPATPTPAPAETRTPASLLIPDRLLGVVTLEEAQQQWPAPIALPAYPPGLGAPDLVYLQEGDGQALLLVWTEVGRPDHPTLGLYQVRSEDFALKAVAIVQRTSVNGRLAYWVFGPHMVRLSNGTVEPQALVSLSALIWTDGEVTYRLEGDLVMEEAIRIAESLQ